MKTTTIILIIGLALFMVPVAFIVISATSYTGTEEIAVVVPEQQALSLMEERVKNDYHYKAYGGHDLELITITKPSLNDCKGLWRDYFGNDAVYQTCYEGVFTFSINDSAPAFVDKYVAKTWVLGTTTKGFEITEQPLLSPVHDFDSCVENGGELLLPDCKGCARSCVHDHNITYHEAKTHV